MAAMADPTLQALASADAAVDHSRAKTFSIAESDGASDAGDATSGTLLPSGDNAENDNAEVDFPGHRLSFMFEDNSLFHRVKPVALRGFRAPLGAVGSLPRREDSERHAERNDAMRDGRATPDTGSSPEEPETCHTQAGGERTRGDSVVNDVSPAPASCTIGGVALSEQFLATTRQLKAALAEQERLAAENASLREMLKVSKATCNTLIRELVSLTGVAPDCVEDRNLQSGDASLATASEQELQEVDVDSEHNAVGDDDHAQMAAMVPSPSSIRKQVTIDLEPQMVQLPSGSSSPRVARRSSLLELSVEAIGDLGRMIGDMWSEDAPDAPAPPEWYLDGLSDNLELADEGRSIRFEREENGENDDALYSFAGTAMPVSLPDGSGFGFQVEVKNVRRDAQAVRSEISIGFTAVPPQLWPVALPETADCLGDVWLVGYMGEAWCGPQQNWVEVPWLLPELAEGDRLSVAALFGEGLLKLWVNDAEVGSIPMPDIRQDTPLWGVVDLLGAKGCVDEVAILPFVQPERS